MDETKAVAAADVQVEEIEITLRGSDFDDFAFRTREEDLASVIEAKVEEARAVSATRRAVADLDGKQAELQEQVRAAQTRIEAATLVNADVAIRRETDAKAALEDQMAAISKQRAALLEA